MILVDTNILLRYILKDDLQLYAASIKILEDNVSLYVTNEVIAEVIYVLTKTYNVSKENASNIFIELIRDNIFELRSKEIIIKSLEIFSENNLDFVDCILCATSKLTENTVVTFDKKLLKCINK